MTNSDDDKQHKPSKPREPKKTVSNDNYRDLAIEMMPSSRKRKFKWRKNER